MSTDVVVPLDPVLKIDFRNDFISSYLSYTQYTECPTFYHRWTAITCLSAYIGKRIFFQHGHFTLYPNLYAMLIGSPGTKKSSAIKIGTKLLRQAGYTTFAAKKTRQEKFLQDMSDQSERLAGINVDEEDMILEHNLWGTGDGEKESVGRSFLDRVPAECFIAADEFNNFIGLGNTDFIAILGELWDFVGTYDYKLKNSKSVYIPDPTVSILGGNTPTGFAQAFPTETIGQGFFSRLLLIYAEPSGIKYTFPPQPDLNLQSDLVEMLHRIREEVVGEVTMTEEATELLHTIYHTWGGIEDLRFEHYSNRRLTHLLKLCLVIIASRISTKIDVQDVIYANTLLTFTEQLMPKALGEFGKARHSAVTHKIMTAIDNTVKDGRAINLQELWKIVHPDLDNRTQLGELIGNLVVAEKIQSTEAGYLPIKKVINDGADGTINWDILTKLERGMK